MAHSVLSALVLALASGGAAAQADDYGVVRMPQYGGGGGADYAAGAPGAGVALEDYRGHSPDAPAPLDYKYEENMQENTEKHTEDTDEVEIRMKPLRKQGVVRRDEEPEPPDILGSTGRRPSLRRRARLKAELERRRRRTRRTRVREHRDRSLDYLDNVDYRSDKNKILDDDIIPFTRRVTTERTIRRKPRDRLFMPPPSGAGAEMSSDEEMEPDRKLKEDMSGGERYAEDRPSPAPRLHPAPRDDDDDEYDEGVGAHAPRGRLKSSKTYHDYGEYYDMNRLIKNKLPMLLRRTTTREPPVPMETRPSSSAPSGTDLLELLWTARRAHSPPPPPPPNATPEITTTTTTDYTATVAMTATRGAPTDTADRSSSELSLAERSRLSILKKAQKKESALGSPAKKPAVLLQVTRKLPTVVMVEPASEGDPWVRARLAEEESPARLDRVKHLMRRKLVARARSIADLTDNWDDMVCDYIDVSLLDAPLHNTAVTAVAIALHIAIIGTTYFIIF